MSEIHFAAEDDAAELIKALADEGYRTRLGPGPGSGDPAWVLTVEPFDERVIDMVDVYGGWVPGDTQLSPESDAD